jgi:hypothetical protein
MKKQESPAFQPEKKNTLLTKEQSLTNGGGVWETFFNANREEIVKALAANKEPNISESDDRKYSNVNQALKNTLEQAIKGLNKDRQKLVSENELYLRGLEYYRDLNDGFGEAKGLEEKYEELRKQASIERANAVVEGFINEEGFDFGDPNDRIEEAVKRFIEESPTDPDVDTFRGMLWTECMARNLG